MKMKSLLTVVVAAGAALLLSSCSLFSSSTSRPSGEVSNSQNVDAFALKVGDCLISTDLGDTFSEVPLVPCTQAHDVEVIKIFDMPDGTFDEAAIDEAGTTECDAAIVDYVGPGYQDIGLGALYFSPTSVSWGNGDREIDCLAYTLSEQLDLTASVKDTAK